MTPLQRNTLVYTAWMNPNKGSWSMVSSFALLPDVSLERRPASEHVGYFVSYFEVQDDPFPTIFRAIQRQKIEDGAKVVFHIDPSVPKHWYRAIKGGITAWNEAFNPKLFSYDVIECIDPEDEQFPDDFHAADVRYNAILWVPTPMY